MNKAKLEKLTKAGWTVGSSADFLNLTPEESAFIEVKVALSKYVHEKRIQNQWTQEKLAQMLKSSQSRVAKIERGDPSVSIDLLIRSLFVMGSTTKELAKAISYKPTQAAGSGSSVKIWNVRRTVKKVPRVRLAKVHHLKLNSTEGTIKI